MIDRQNLQRRYNLLLREFFGKMEERALFDVSKLARDLVTARLGPDVLLDIHSRSLKGIINDLDPKTASRKVMVANDLLLNGIMTYSMCFYSYAETMEKNNRELELRSREVEAANRELDAFAYSVSHDLRAPLRAMAGFSQALLEDYGDKLEGDAKTYLDQIIDGSRHMGQLIDGLLTLSRITRGELRREPIDLSKLAERIRGELEQSERERKVEWRIEPGLCASGDGRMIEVVMRNLLDNAWKYTSVATKPLIRVYSEMDGDERFFFVADNGAGFDMAYSGKLFQPFQRLHRQNEFPGLGIGLATVQRVVHRHGGKIHATGTPGQGATFSFSLPGSTDS